MSNAASAKARLMSELKALDKEKFVNVEVEEGGLFKWNVGLVVINPDSIFHGGYFKAEMTFTDRYPYAPPTFKFIRKIFHPNIYPDGKLCISILHAPGEDEQSGELAEERWSPVQSVESVLRSILVLLDNPEISSPANVDASVMYRDDRAQYNEKAKDAVKASQQDIPASYVMPTTLDTAPPAKMDDDENFWADSDAEDDFGASDSSGEDMEDDEDADEQESEEGDDEELEK